MPLHLFERQRLPATPWKNGGGLTREIACHPAQAGLDAFDWRVSIAHIGRSGPFSTFAGVDRVITLLEGAGMRLHSPDAAIDQRLDTPLAPYAFAGEVPIQATLLGGDCQDFNVMTRRHRCRARVRLCTASTALPAADGGVLLALHGRWQAGTQHTLAPGQGLWWHDEALAWPLQCQAPDAALLAVSIHTLTPP